MRRSSKTRLLLGAAALLGGAVVALPAAVAGPPPLPVVDITGVDPGAGFLVASPEERQRIVDECGYDPGEIVSASTATISLVRTGTPVDPDAPDALEQAPEVLVEAIPQPAPPEGGYQLGTIMFDLEDEIGAIPPFGPTLAETATTYVVRVLPGDGYEVGTQAEVTVDIPVREGGTFVCEQTLPSADDPGAGTVLARTG
jgi:hypothetical protein